MNLPIPLLLVTALTFTGCQHISVADQPTLRRPVFDFQAQRTRVLEGSLVGQIETGRGGVINGSSGVCSSCQ